MAFLFCAVDLETFLAFFLVFLAALGKGGS
jgi:hypothetical protein